MVGGWVDLAEWRTGGEVKVNSIFVVNVFVGVSVLRGYTIEAVSGSVSGVSNSGF